MTESTFETPTPPARTVKFKARGGVAKARGGVYETTMLGYLTNRGAAIGAVAKLGFTLDAIEWCEVVGPSGHKTIVQFQRRP